MKIGIDISQLVYEGTGVARFTRGLVDVILDRDTTNEWVFFFSSLRRKLPSDLVKKIHDKGHRLVSLPLPPTLLSFMWNDLHIIPIETFTGKLDWFITSDWTEPPARCKKATIVHDLVFKRYPETVTPKILSTQKKRLAWVKKESHLIITDSNATRDDVVNMLKVNETCAHVIYPGVTVKKTTPVRTPDRPFILTVGKIEPRKNLNRLIEAYNRLPPGPQLFIVGPQGWGDMEPVDNPNIRFLGHVTDVELYALYSSCLFFILPSIWEGFGYPVVEAMKLGAPVTLSDTSSLFELGRNAGLFFDPMDVESIQNAMRQMITDADLRSKLKTKGLEKSTQFTWENYYNQLMKLL